MISVLGLFSVGLLFKFSGIFLLVCDWPAVAHDLGVGGERGGLLP